MSNPSLNAFAQAPIQGQLDLRFNANTMSALIDVSTAGGLVAGQAVKRVTGTAPNTMPKVVECALNSDDVFGFINYSIKDQSFEAQSLVEISAMRDNVMYMTASAAIVANAKVGIVVTGRKVVTATSGLMNIGRALDEAKADGDLIRVIIDLPGAVV